MTIRGIWLSGACALAVAAVGCSQQNSGGMAMNGNGHKMSHGSPWASIHKAVATIYPTKGNGDSGSVTFTDVPGGVHIQGMITGLDPNSVHGFHIHQYGDQTSTDGSSAGGHYNPEGEPHGSPQSAMHHAGDLGNITADASGMAMIDMTAKGITVAGMHDPVLGRGVVIHAKADDMHTQPTGNAGGRIGVGVIGVAKE